MAAEPDHRSFEADATRKATGAGRTLSATMPRLILEARREAAHTVWIWPDRSPSMVFASALVWETKLDRALVVAFALAEVLVEGGERVGMPGLMRPSASRNIIERMAETIVHDPTERASLPPSFAPSPH